jgi:hypothetical protein
VRTRNITRVKLRKSVEQAAAIERGDDATCQSYGATPGSAVYVQCRMNISNQREVNRLQGQALLGAYLLSHH